MSLKRILLTSTVLSFLGITLHADKAFARDPELEEFGDVMQIALPLGALAGTFVADDSEGRWMYGKSFLAMQGLTQGLKISIGKLRPGGSSRTSYPSGHTAAAFSGASFIEARYGPWFGVPAYIAAAMTGYSRIDSDNHFTDDVIAGAAIGTLTSLYFTSPHSTDVKVTPANIGDGYGMKVGVDMHPEAPKRKMLWSDVGLPDPGFKRKFRFEIGLGPIFQGTNDVQSPSDGTKVKLDSLDGIDDPVQSADANITWFVDDRQEVTLAFNPYELRDNGQFTQATTFGGKTFPANTAMRTQYKVHDYRASYTYALWRGTEGNWKINLGGGLDIRDTTVSIHRNDGVELREKKNSWSIMPFAKVSGEYRITDKIDLFAGVEGMATGDQHLFDANTGVRYRLNERWDAGMRYNLWSGETDVSGLNNKYLFHGINFTVGYSF